MGFNGRNNWTKFQMIPPTHKVVSWTLQANMPVIKVSSVTTSRKCMKLHERAPYSEEDSSIDNKIDSGKYRTQAANMYRGADKSLARPTSRCILFDGENISFDASLVIYINSTNIPPIMITNRIY